MIIKPKNEIWGNLKSYTVDQTLQRIKTSSYFIEWFDYYHGPKTTFVYFLHWYHGSKSTGMEPVGMILFTYIIPITGTLYHILLSRSQLVIHSLNIKCSLNKLYCDQKVFFCKYLCTLFTSSLQKVTQFLKHFLCNRTTCNNIKYCLFVLIFWN